MYLVRAPLRPSSAINSNGRPSGLSTSRSSAATSRYRLQLHIRRSLVDRADLGVAIEFLHRVVLRVPVPAMQLERERRDALGDLGRDQLRHRAFQRNVASRVFQSRRVVNQQSRPFQLGARLCELKLYRLELADRLAELASFLRVIERGVKGAVRDADHLRADADAPAIQRVDGDLVALADRPEHVVVRHLDTVENQLRRARRANTELVLLLADAESSEPSLDDERRDTLIARARIRVREHDVDLGLGAVRDPQLASGENPAVATLLGSR